MNFRALPITTLLTAFSTLSSGNILSPSKTNTSHINKSALTPIGGTTSRHINPADLMANPADPMAAAAPAGYQRLNALTNNSTSTAPRYTEGPEAGEHEGQRSRGLQSLSNTALVAQQTLIGLISALPNIYQGGVAGGAENNVGFYLITEVINALNTFSNTTYGEAAKVLSDETQSALRQINEFLSVPSTADLTQLKNNLLSLGNSTESLVTQADAIARRLTPEQAADFLDTASRIFDRTASLLEVLSTEDAIQFKNQSLALLTQTNSLLGHIDTLAQVVSPEDATTLKTSSIALLGSANNLLSHLGTLAGELSQEQARKLTDTTTRLISRADQIFETITPDDAINFKNQSLALLTETNGLLTHVRDLAGALTLSQARGLSDATTRILSRAALLTETFSQDDAINLKNQSIAVLTQATDLLSNVNNIVAVVSRTDAQTIKVGSISVLNNADLLLGRLTGIVNQLSDEQAEALIDASTRLVARAADLTETFTREDAVRAKNQSLTLLGVTNSLLGHVDALAQELTPDKAATIIDASVSLFSNTDQLISKLRGLTDGLTAEEFSALTNNSVAIADWLKDITSILPPEKAAVLVDSLTSSAPLLADLIKAASPEDIRRLFNFSSSLTSWGQTLLDGVPPEKAAQAALDTFAIVSNLRNITDDIASKTDKKFIHSLLDSVEEGLSSGAHLLKNVNASATPEMIEKLVNATTKDLSKVLEYLGSLLFKTDSNTGRIEYLFWATEVKTWYFTLLAAVLGTILIKRLGPDFSKAMPYLSYFAARGVDGFELARKTHEAVNSRIKEIAQQRGLVESNKAFNFDQPFTDAMSHVFIGTLNNAGKANEWIEAAETLVDRLANPTAGDDTVANDTSKQKLAKEIADYAARIKGFAHEFYKGMTAAATDSRASSFSSTDEEAVAGEAATPLMLEAAELDLEAGLGLEATAATPRMLGEATVQTVVRLPILISKLDSLLAKIDQQANEINTSLNPQTWTHLREASTYLSQGLNQFKEAVEQNAPTAGDGGLSDMVKKFFNLGVSFISYIKAKDSATGVIGSLSSAAEAAGSSAAKPPSRVATVRRLGESRNKGSSSKNPA